MEAIGETGQSAGFVLPKHYVWVWPKLRNACALLKEERERDRCRAQFSAAFWESGTQSRSETSSVIRRRIRG